MEVFFIACCGLWYSVYGFCTLCVNHLTYRFVLGFVPERCGAEL